MKLKLDGKRVQLRPHISRLIVHDESGVAQFKLECENAQEAVKFSPLKKDPNDMLIKSKEILTNEKGVEAFGLFVTGAEKENPVYLHLLTVYLPEENSSFVKYHITLEDKLEHLDLEDILLLTAECYAVMYPALMEFRKDGLISVDKYPLLKQFFARKYTFTPFRWLGFP